MEETKSILLEVEYDRRKFRRYSLFGLWVFAAAFGYLFIFGEFFVEQRLWACLTMFFGMVPFMIFFWKEHLGRLPFFPLLCFYHAIAFGLPGLFEDVGGLPPPMVLEAVQASAWSLLSLLVGYYFFGPKLFPHVSPFRMSFQPSMEVVLPYAWIFLILDQVLEPIPRPWGLLVFAQQVIPVFGWMGLSILLLNFLRDGDLKKRGNFILVCLILPYEILWRFTSGALGQVMVLGILIGIVFVNYRKAIPFQLMAGAAVIFLLLQPVKAEFRELTWGDSAVKMNLLEKAKLYISLAVDHYGHPQVVEKHAGTPDAITRLSQLGLLAAVMDLSPAQVPFRNGSTYAPLVFKWIPRLIWSGKPTENIGNAAGHWYNIIADDDENTSINLPWLVEFYVNFGWPGLIGGMFLLGIFIYYLSEKLCNENQGILEYGITLSLIYNIWWAESNFSLIWGGVIINVMAFYFFFWILSKTNSRLTASPV